MRRLRRRLRGHRVGVIRAGRLRVIGRLIRIRRLIRIGHLIRIGRLIRIRRLLWIRSRRDRLVDVDRSAGVGEHILRLGSRRRVGLADRRLSQRGKGTRAPKRKGQRQQSRDYPLVFHDAFLLRWLRRASGNRMRMSYHISLSDLLLKNALMAKPAARRPVGALPEGTPDFGACIPPKPAESPT